MEYTIEDLKEVVSMGQRQGRYICVLLLTKEVLTSKDHCPEFVLDSKPKAIGDVYDITTPSPSLLHIRIQTQLKSKIYIALSTHISGA